MTKSGENKKGFKKIAKEHWEVVLEDINDKFEVVKEINQAVNGITDKVDILTDRVDKLTDKTGILTGRVDTLTDRFDRFETRFDQFERETKSNFGTLFKVLSQVDLFELQERVVKIERHLELKK